MNRVGIDELPVGKSEYDRADFWIARRDFVDEVVQKPARTLVRLVDCSLNRFEKHRTFTVPVKIDNEMDEQETYQGPSPLVHAVACSAVQALYDDRRRYPWLKSVDTQLIGLHQMIPEAFVNDPKLGEKDLIHRLDVLGDPAFGALNPVTAAEVFWVLIRAGERYAHGQLGFLALFSLLWALKRQTHGRFVAGASLGYWRPSVAVTARCLLPILKLTRIIKRRANLYREAAKHCSTLQETERAATEYERWKFASTIEQLGAVLYRLADISINRDEVEKVARAVTALADPIVPQTATGPIAEAVRRELRTLFLKLGEQNESILVGAHEATHNFQSELIGMLEDPSRREELRRKCNLPKKWDEHLQGAREANAVCAAALGQLQLAVVQSHRLPPETAFTNEALLSTLDEFAKINDDLVRILREAIEDNAEWCRSAVPREVAFASAGNDSEFDVAELLSGLVIARSTDQITRASIEDAVRLSLRAARPDGSWASDQPIYVEKHFVGVWPGTADLLFLLSTAVHSRGGLVSGPDVADRHLLRYVALLEARRRKKLPKWWKEEEEVWGFPSESREDFVDTWETAMAVRGLLEIREVIEERLWEICDERFTIPRPQTKLADLDPVDLGARHDRRLQTRLIRGAAKAGRFEKGADYGYVMHGPPGSSKTALAEAISMDMWPRAEPHFVRITPADFTRRGEGGIDYEARFIFRLLSHVRRVTIFFDEIDDLLRKRKIDAEVSFIRLVIPGMLNRLQDLRDAAPRQEICFLLATNYIDQIEPALTRRGRIDAVIPVPYPDAWSRESILERVISEHSENIPADLPRTVKNAVVSLTAEWPWSTYQKLCGKIVRERCQSPAEVEAIIETSSGDLERADSYYKTTDRWKNTSPLANEFAHFAFGTSKFKQDCRNRVVELEAHLHKYDAALDDLKLVERFEAAWRDTGRG